MLKKHYWNFFYAEINFSFFHTIKITKEVCK